MVSLPPPSGIQTIDISPLISSKDPFVRKAKIDELVAAIHVQGACGIVGHGIKIDRLREAFKWSAKFFDLPQEEKAKANHVQGRVPHRGYSGIGREKCLIYTEEELKSMSGELAADAKKALDFKVLSSYIYFLVITNNEDRSTTILEAMESWFTTTSGLTSMPYPVSVPGHKVITLKWKSLARLC